MPILTQDDLISLGFSTVAMKYHKAKSILGRGEFIWLTIPHIGVQHQSKLGQELKQGKPWKRELTTHRL